MIIRTASARVTVAALTLCVVACASDQPTVCKSLPGTAEELAATPRDDENLELLALRLSDGITAGDAVYQRLKLDIAAIRARAPEVRGIQYFAPYQQGLYVSLDDTSYQKAKEGKFSVWDCLNRHFGAAEISPAENNGLTLSFKGRYELWNVASLYRRVSGVTLAQPLIAAGDGPTIYVTPDAETWHYVFDHASGDCPSGCTVHDAHYFVVGKDGVPQLGGRWASADIENPPGWAETYLLGTAQRWRDQPAAQINEARARP